MKSLLSFVFATLLCACAYSQDRTVQNRPYTDLRPFHFGILVGTHMQDMELLNVGPQTITLDDGSVQSYTITTDQDKWDNGFNVGVLGEARLNDYFSFRLAPALYFGSRHITYRNNDPQAPDSLRSRTQNLKSIYISCSADIIYASKRAGNHRPYLMAGLSPVINLSGRNDDILKLKRYDVYFETGVGCDFYLPFFKLRPELKFMFGLTNSLDKGYASRLRDASMRPFASSVSEVHSKMIVLTFYFE